MPNRVIKESLCTSDNISELSDFEFRLWIGLIVIADDFGRGDARPAIIKGRCFPLRERVTIKDIECALHGLAAHSCVSLYKVGGKPYYSFPTWAAHQRIDRAKPKYPSPEEADPEDSAADCRKSPQIAADCRKSRAESNPIRIQSESESKSNVKARATRFTPPTLAELQDFVAENGLKLDVSRFMDYYTANGWKVGRNAMKDWRATARNWSRQTPSNQAKSITPASNPALNYTQRTETNYGSTFINLLDEYGGESK